MEQLKNKSFRKLLQKMAQHSVEDIVRECMVTALTATLFGQLPEVSDITEVITSKPRKDN